MSRETDLKRLLNKINAFEALLGAISNDKDRFFLAFNSNRVIGSDSDVHKISSSEIESDYIVPFAETKRR